MFVFHLWWYSALSFFLSELLYEELLSNFIECFTDVKWSFGWGLEKHNNLLLLHPCFCIFFGHLPLVFKVQVCTHKDKNGIFGGISPCLFKPALKGLKRGLAKIRERIPCTGMRGIKFITWVSSIWGKGKNKGISENKSWVKSVIS